MDVDPETAKALGFPKPAFTVVEHERRWLCRDRDVPRDDVIRSERITDLYVAGSRLRLREARPVDGGPARLRLSRKADVDARTRLVTSIYLPEEEFTVLAASLPGLRLEKLRHTLRSPPGVVLSVDRFQGELDGLVMVEAEFSARDVMAAFPAPAFAFREVTDDPRYGGGHLAKHGLPDRDRRWEAPP
jgi:CYTH domain-containing protein